MDSHGSRAKVTCLPRDRRKVSASPIGSGKQEAGSRKGTYFSELFRLRQGRKLSEVYFLKEAGDRVFVEREGFFFFWCLRA